MVDSWHLTSSFRRKLDGLLQGWFFNIIFGELVFDLLLWSLFIVCCHPTRSDFWSFKIMEHPRPRVHSSVLASSPLSQWQEQQQGECRGCLYNSATKNELIKHPIGCLSFEVSSFPYKGWINKAPYWLSIQFCFGGYPTLLFEWSPIVHWHKLAV